MRSYNVFRRKGGEALCCAVPESRAVPRFVGGRRWIFGGKIDADAAPPPASTTAPPPLPCASTASTCSRRSTTGPPDRRIADPVELSLRAVS